MTASEAAASIGVKRGPSPSSAAPTQPKRPKAAQACLSCRKHKTRCEMLEGDNSGSHCHRCKVLSLPCSFDATNATPASAASDSASTSALLPPQTTHTQDRASTTTYRSGSKSANQSASPYDPPSTGKKSDTAMEDVITPRSERGWMPRQEPYEFKETPDTNEVEFTDPAKLLPERHRPWGFLKLPGGFDGTMVPMLAMQALTRAGPWQEPTDDSFEQPLLRILGRDQVQSLCDLFEERYAPWVNLPPSKYTESPLLRLAQCCIASRHLDPQTRSVVTPQLYQLAEEILFRQTYNPLPSTDSIQAILILSMWEPVGDPSHTESKDSRLIASSAVSMAMNLRLSEAMVYAKSLRNGGTQASESHQTELAEAMDKARLWFALTSVEATLCLGSGRDPISSCDSLIYEALETSSLASVGLGRDMRLSLVSQIYASTQKALVIHLENLSEIGPFYRDMLNYLMHMDVFERILSPLPVLAEHEPFYFHMMQMHLDVCRLQVLTHALIEAKTAAVKDGRGEHWFKLAEHNGINLARSWGQYALVVSERIMLLVLECKEADNGRLASAPDIYFNMITLASFFIILAKWSTLQDTGEPLPGSSDSLLARTVERLSQTACSPEHQPAKCARVINAGILSFRKRASGSDKGATPDASGACGTNGGEKPNAVGGSDGGVRKGEGDDSEGGPSGGGGGGGSGSNAPHRQPIQEHFHAATRDFTERVAALPGSMPSGMGHGLQEAAYPQVYPATFPMQDPSYFMSSDIFLDNNFWQSFMTNISDGSSGGYAPHGGGSGGGGGGGYQ
ncbi:hypothetical protein CONPUDRAFT_168789 [Coniophora puteana RWD-64-598 SS2]|uniref:Zn(2)-C6 fungal-type domain-containing protein n=1 Tax=Coniophora puteana (strain RWD-64-598) TaxID=741705 RepID=A0A5M3MAA2_CONPW|nr:uncharacterized protein CONPUDRAFT_168789 [Coniophora puteana RWD-64-598 SS2]EIW76212.1 hypothetical protein CONPUDRAFT_168789 [Coniophora puteana RWD-64-598 SS2]